MTTHQTPPQNSAVTRETWRAMVEENNQSAATDPVDFVVTLSPHYNPRRQHRWLWHFAIPIGELEPGVQATVSRSGTASSEAAAQRKINRHVSRHFAEAAGLDPHGDTLNRIRGISLSGLVVAGFALVAMSAGCSPSFLGTLALGAAAVGLVATIAKSRRAQARRL